jgi:hypothetical protein
MSMWLDADLSNKSTSGQIVSNVNLFLAESDNLGAEALRISGSQDA